MDARAYRVRPGDSLSVIAHEQLGSAARWPWLFAFNNRKDVVAVTHHALTDADKLRVGQKLMIPLTRHGHPLRPLPRHPLQTTTPRIVPHGKPAHAAAGPGMQKPGGAPPPGGKTSSSHAAAAGGQGESHGNGTTLNDFPFKYKIEIKKQAIEGPNYTGTVKLECQLTVWIDKQIPYATITNKGFEAAAKTEADSTMAKLVQDEKISWEPGSNKATFEDMLTLNAHGAPPSLSSVGFAIDSDNPIPAMRFKFQSPKLQGKFLNHLYIAENLVITVDLRPKPRGPDMTRRPDPVQVPVPQPVPRPVTQPVPQPWWQRAGNWVADHRVEIGVGVVVTAVVVSNVLTAGADTEADPAVAAWALRAVQAARAARAVAPLAAPATGGMVPAF